MGLRFDRAHKQLFNSSRLERAVVIDTSGGDSDRLNLTVNLEGVDGGPSRDAVVSVSWMQGKRVVSDFGNYIINRVQFSGPPFKSVITASKAPFKVEDETDFNKRRSKSYENLSFGALVDQIMSKHGFSVRVDPDLSSEVIDYIDQSDESDHAFLMRLARDRGSIAKAIYQDQLTYVVCKRGRESSFSGKEIASVSIEYDSKIRSYSYDEPGRVAVKGVEVCYVDPETKTERFLQIGSSPLKRFAHKFQGKEQARNFAESQVESLEKSKKTLMLTLFLEPSVVAETPVILGGKWPKVLHGKWIVGRAVHDFASKRTDLILTS